MKQIDALPLYENSSERNLAMEVKKIYSNLSSSKDILGDYKKIKNMLSKLKKGTRGYNEVSEILGKVEKAMKNSTKDRTLTADTVIKAIKLYSSVKTADADVDIKVLRAEVRNAKVGKVEVNYEEGGREEVAGFTVNWPGIGSVSPDEAIRFANDIIKAAQNAKKLDQKFKGADIL